MARPLKPDPPRKMNISLPSSLANELELRLYSPLLNRVPHGAFSLFFETLTRQALAAAAAQPQGGQDGIHS